MATSGPVSAADLARMTKLNPRMLRAWLNAMAAAEHLDYQPAEQKYILPRQFVAAGASKLPAGRFDLLTMFDAVHHLPDPAAALESARKCGKRG